MPCGFVSILIFLRKTTIVFVFNTWLYEALSLSHFFVLLLFSLFYIQNCKLNSITMCNWDPLWLQEFKLWFLGSAKQSIFKKYISYKKNLVICPFCFFLMSKVDLLLIGETTRKNRYTMQTWSRIMSLIFLASVLINRPFMLNLTIDCSHYTVILLSPPQRL